MTNRMKRVDEELVTDVLDLNGPFAQFLDREREIYCRAAGREASLDGFRDHMMKVLRANPGKIPKLLLDDCATVVWETRHET